MAPPPARAAAPPTPAPARSPRPPEERPNWWGSLPFFAAHALCLAAIFTGVTPTALILFAALFVGRAVFVTAGYHRYFSHKSYRLNRFWQAVWAVGAESTAQKGVLWWAANHRLHHRFADTPGDPHSPTHGWWWSHVGWILCERNKRPDYTGVKDFAQYPELVWLDRHDWVAPWTLGLVAFLVGGWPGLVVGFFWSTVLLWHTTFLVNSAGHLFGRRRYATPDTSRNSALLALVTGGEGWHNNHHHYQASARQGFFWWELDTTWYFLRACRALGIVHDLKVPPRHVRDATAR
jgi:stearoyl-CoA desaturase (Delta-9 desaturase)